MKPFLTVLAVASLLVLPARTHATSSVAGAAAPQAGRPRTPPAGWSETTSKASDLIMEGKEQAALAIYEQWVASHPDFWEGHFGLGGAHEAIARAVFSRRTPDPLATRTKHFEAAAVHMRRGLELAGPEASFGAMRCLIDLYGVLWLNRPAEHLRLVREGVARYPAEPLAHAYLLEVLATQGEPIEAAARAARAAIPKGPDARVTLASALVKTVADLGRLTPALTPALLPEASRLVDEALTLKPGHAEALSVRRHIESVRTMSPERPPADEAGVQGAVRAIAAAQFVYAAVCGHGRYAPTLAALARPEPGQKVGFLGGDLVPAGNATVLERYRYRIEMVAVPSPRSATSCNGVAAGGSAETFSVVARPLEGFHGRAFRMDWDGKLTDIK